MKCKNGINCDCVKCGWNIGKVCGYNYGEDLNEEIENVRKGLKWIVCSDKKLIMNNDDKEYLIDCMKRLICLLEEGE